MAIKTPDENNNNVISEEKTKKTISKEIEVDLHDEPDTMQVDFEDETLANSFASKQTKPSKEQPKIDEHKNADEIKQEVETYEQQKTGKLEFKDLEKQAEFFINMFDTALSTLFNFIAGGSHSTDYRLLPNDKKNLTYQLAIILSKYQSKFKVEYVFLMGLMVMYVPITTAAIKNRKENKSKKSQSQQTKQVEKKQIVEEVRKPIEQQPILEKIDLPSATPDLESKPVSKRGPRKKAY